MKAVKTVALGRAEVVDGIPVPSIAGHPGYILVKTKYVGVAHCDYLFTDLELVYVEGITIGGEYFGEVVEADTTCTRFKKGDKISGCVFPSNLTMPNGGTHAEFILVKGDAQVSVDALGDSVNEEQAATIGIVLSTVFSAFYNSMGLPWPGESFKEEQANFIPEASRQVVLIYGGSTSVGMLAIQFAKLSRLTVLTTCSPRNFDLVKSLGADVALDYHDAEKCIEGIRHVAGDGLTLVLDCYSAHESPRISAEVISSRGGHYNSLSPVAFPREDVKLTFVQGQKVLGEPFQFAGQTVPADQEAFNKYRKFIPIAEQLIKTGQIKLSPVETLNGLDGVLEAMQRLREWKASAKKYVCRLG